jgi:hypothetical protein
VGSVFLKCLLGATHRIGGLVDGAGTHV